MNVEGQLREPAKRFRVTVPRDMASQLTERFRSGGVSVEVAEGQPAGSTNTIVNLLR